MSINIAINGYGRIGRLVLRAVYECNRQNDIKVVAINDLGPIDTNIYLTKHDSVHGRFNADVTRDGDDMVVNGDKIRVFAEKDPAKLPWKDLDVDVVMECTGIFRTPEKAGIHLQGGAKKVLVSAPAGKDADATIVYGVNQSVLKASDKIVSNASCTTNCLAPVVKPLHEALKIKKGLMVTIHSVTNDQVLLDTMHKDVRRGRSATLSIIPTKTGAAAAVGLVLPELAGKLDGYAMRVPTVNVSVVDLTFEAERSTTVEEVNEIVKNAATGELKGILAYNNEPLVSHDFNHDPASSTFDATQTRVLDNMVKIVAWYDNEWGFSCRMLDTALAMMNAK
jgi:glyceraldehyde 3-phosphate dehydrogenase